MHDHESRMRLARLLRQERERAGLKQAELAERLGVPQSFISKCESGERRIDVLDLSAICRGLGVSIAEFIARLDTALESEG